MDERRERFRRIYDVNYTSLLGYALRRTDSPADAHDVVADTFLVAWRRLEDVPEGDRARLWLYGTARKVLANHHRGQRRRRRLAGRLQHDRPREIEGESRANGVGEVEQIAAAFERLSETDRELLILVGWEQLDAGQLAEVLDCSPTAARVRLHRARKRFQNELDAEGVKQSTSAGHGSSRWATARPDAEESL